MHRRTYPTIETPGTVIDTTCCIPRLAFQKIFSASTKDYTNSKPNGFFNFNGQNDVIETTQLANQSQGECHAQGPYRENY